MNQLNKWNCLVVLGIILVVIAGCDIKSSFTSINETKVISVNANPFDPNMAVAGVKDDDDAFIPNFVRGASLGNVTWVKRCTRERYDLERAEAIAAAKANRNLIPVKFSLLTGSLFDSLAYAAHRRSILRKDSNLKSRIYVGPAKSFVYEGPNAYHYIVDHSVARANFQTGAKCFFDTVSIDSGVVGEILNEAGNPEHGYRIFYYGDLYPHPENADIVDGGVSPRLFKKVTDVDVSVEDPQVVPIFVADIREKMLAELGIDVSILNPAFVSSAVRRHEYQLGYKKIFDLKALWANREPFTRILSTDRVLNDNGLRSSTTDVVKRAYSAYEGVPQLVDWIVFSGLAATVMSTQYTPIVLDLGEEKIRTSSLEWGTFFNLAGLKQKTNGKPVTHLTSWLGGYVTKSEGNSVVENSLERVADDGFLVLPNADGTVTGAGNLFGDSFTAEKDGKKVRFENGFLALAALANKDCTSSDPKKRYVGPWDGDVYTTTLKVWVDRNRNGVAESSEVKGLRESGVAAMNACYIVHAQNKDKFGNRTENRAAFLKLEAGDSAGITETEILARLASGRTSTGANATFRVMIDVFFNTLPQSYLEEVDLGQVQFSDGTPVPPLH